jgi:threonine efflux protein
MLLVTRTALRSGLKSGLQVACGIGCGLAVHATVAVSGLVMLLQRFDALRSALQWLAAVYLLWIAWGLLRECYGIRRGAAGHEAASHASMGSSPFLRGLFCNLLNPKVALFLAAVCAPFLGQAATMQRALVVWWMIVGLGCGLWCAWVWVLQWPTVQRAYLRAAVWIDTVFALLLVLLALRLIRS